MVLFWHRRDLRVEDNAGLFKALKENDKVQPIFIFDQNILAELPSNDQRVRFIHQEIQGLKLQYQTYGSDLKVYVGNPKDLILKITTEHRCTKVYTNRDYEPYALERDKTIFSQLEKINVAFIGTIHAQSQKFSNRNIPESYLVGNNVNIVCVNTVQQRTIDGKSTHSLH